MHGFKMIKEHILRTHIERIRNSIQMILLKIAFTQQIYSSLDGHLPSIDQKRLQL